MQKFESHKIKDKEQEYITYDGMTYVIEETWDGFYAMRVQDGYAYVEDEGNKWDLHYIYRYVAGKATAIWASVERLKGALGENTGNVVFFAGYCIDPNEEDEDDVEVLVYDYNGNVYK